jgi:hypothetical protein
MLWKCFPRGIKNAKLCICLFSGEIKQPEQRRRRTWNQFRIKTNIAELISKCFEFRILPRAKKVISKTFFDGSSAFNFFPYPKYFQSAKPHGTPPLMFPLTPPSVEVAYLQNVLGSSACPDPDKLMAASGQTQSKSLLLHVFLFFSQTQKVVHNAEKNRRRSNRTLERGEKATHFYLQSSHAKVTTSIRPQQHLTCFRRRNDFARKKNISLCLLI